MKNINKRNAIKKHIHIDELIKSIIITNQNISHINGGIDTIMLSTAVTKDKAEIYLNKLKELCKFQWRSSGKAKNKKINTYLPNINIVKSVRHEAYKHYYKNGFSIFIKGSKSPIRIFIGHSKDEHDSNLIKIAFMYSPIKNSIESVFKLRKTLSHPHLFGDEIFTIFRKSKISKIHYNFDISGYYIDKCFYLVEGKKMFKAYMSKNGILETLYHGTENGQVCIYNKKIQMNKKKNKGDASIAKLGTQYIPPKGEYTRAEVRLEPKNESLKDYLKKIARPRLSDIEIYADLESLTIDPVYRAAFQALGFQPILNLMPPAEKVAMIESISSAKCKIKEDRKLAKSDIDKLKILSFTNENLVNEIFNKYPEFTRNYIHTGIITAELANIAKKHQCTEIKDIYADAPNDINSDIKSSSSMDTLIGYFITRKQAHALLKIEHSS